MMNLVIIKWGVFINKTSMAESESVNEMALKKSLTQWTNNVENVIIWKMNVPHTRKELLNSEW